MVLNIESISAKLSTALLEPASVLVVSIVNSMTSVTLASITVPAALDVMLFNESGNMIISARLLPRIDILDVNMFIVTESDNSLLPANSLVVVSVKKKVSDELLVSVNNLVVSIVK